MGLTRIRRENPAFNYGFFRPNPLVFGWVTWKNEEHAPSLPAAPPHNKPKLLDQVRDVIRRKHFSIRTEQSYVDWVRRFILFHNKRHPREMAEEEVKQF